MILWEILSFLAVVFIIFVASCVGVIIIYVWILMAEWAKSVGDLLVELVESRRKENNKGSGN